MSEICDDCGKPAEPFRVMQRDKAWCAEHGKLRWDMGCDKTTPGWLFRPGALYYTGPLPTVVQVD